MTENKRNDRILKELLEYIKYKMILAQEALEINMGQIYEYDKISLKNFIFTHKSYNNFYSDDTTQNEIIDKSKKQFLNYYSKNVELTKQEMDELLSLVSLYFKEFGIDSIKKSFTFNNEKQFILLILKRLKNKIGLLKEQTNIQQIDKWIWFLSIKNSSAFLNYINPKIEYTNGILSLSNSDGSQINCSRSNIEKVYSCEELFVCTFIKPNNNGVNTEQLLIMADEKIGEDYFYKNILNPRDKCLYSTTQGYAVLDIKGDVYNIRNLIKKNNYVDVNPKSWTVK